jgi:hypothetical protein
MIMGQAMDHTGSALSSFAELLPAPDSELAQQAAKDPFQRHAAQDLVTEAQIIDKGPAKTRRNRSSPDTHWVCKVPGENPPRDPE